MPSLSLWFPVKTALLSRLVLILSPSSGGADLMMCTLRGPTVSLSLASQVLPPEYHLVNK